jgi:hypothetical protein
VDLHRIVRETADEHPDVADPGALADLVFEKIDPQDYAQAIGHMLRSYVRDVVRAERRFPSSDPARVPVQVGLAPSVTPFRPSPFVTGVRDTWRKRLGARIHVGEGSWKFLRECTLADLKSAADERRRLAAENAASARVYEALATALEEHAADIVSDLSENVLRRILD